MAPKCTVAVFGDTKITTFFTFNSFSLVKIPHYQWQYPEHAVAQLVEALPYKSEGHGFDSQWRHWNFSLT